MISDLSASIDRTVTATAKVCVIGAGIAGLLASKRIADSGQNVIVLESGGQKPDARLEELNELDEPARLYRTARTGRVRALGGTSTVWGGRMMPLTAHDMAPRDYLGLGGWPIDKAELDRYLPAIEELFGLDDSSFENDLDLPFAMERLSRPSEYIRSRWAKWPTFRRRNVAKLLSAQARADPRLQIWINATAHRFSIDTERGRLDAVYARTADGKSIKVVADEFILTCGTLETTRLLLLLDQTSNGRAFGECDALGRYFNDHLAIQVAQLRPPVSAMANRIFGYHIGGRTRRSLHLETTAHAQREDEVASGFVTVRPEFNPQSIPGLMKSLGQSAQSGATGDPISSKELFKNAMALGPALYWTFVHKQMHFGGYVDLFLDARIEQVPSFGSRLTLSDTRDRFGIPRLRLAWEKSPADERTFRAVVRRAQRFWRSTILEAACPVAWDRDPDDACCTFAQGSRDTRHPAGSARMGHHRRTSVVGRDLRCHAVPNLLVASAAVFPSSGSANPTLTIMQLALLAADGVLKPSRASTVATTRAFGAVVHSA